MKSKLLSTLILVVTLTFKVNASPFVLECNYCTDSQKTSLVSDMSSSGFSDGTYLFAIRV